MNCLNQDKQFFIKLMNMMEQQFGPDCEIVLHDLTKPYDKTIVDIRNGHVTGRNVGDGGSNLGLEVLKGTVSDGDRYNYITYLKSSRILRSSSMYIRDDEGSVIACLCVNEDITDVVKFEEYLKRNVQFSVPQEESERQNDQTAEYFPSGVQDLLDYLISESQRAVGVPKELMSKEDKIAFMRLLDAKGAFLITKSSEKVCEYLGVSRFTFYKYLEGIRADSKQSGGDAAGK